MARPSHEPTEGLREQVGLWSAAGLKQERCASMVGLCVETFRKHYKDDYDGGKDNMIGALVEQSYKVAVDTDHRDSSKERQFLLKTRGGFKETSVQETHIKELPKEITWTVAAKPSK